MGAEEEQDLLRKVGKKSEKSRSNDTNDVVEATDCRDATAASGESSLKLKVKDNGRRNKKDTDVKRKKKNGGMNVAVMENVERKRMKGKDQDVVGAGAQEIIFEKSGDENVLEEKDSASAESGHKGSNVVVKGNRSVEEEYVTKVEYQEDGAKKKKKKGMRDGKSSDVKGEKPPSGQKEGEKSGKASDEDVEKVERKKRKREKTSSRDDLGSELQEIVFEKSGSEEDNVHRDMNETREIGAKSRDVGKRRKLKSPENGSDSSKPKEKSKKVSFSDDVEVFLLQGERFTPEEDAIIIEAVHNYVKEHDLGEDGVEMVLNCSAHPKIKNCWKEIAAAIPYRPYAAIYFRAHNVFERDGSKKWTDDEFNFLREYYRKHGPKWKLAADVLGKHRVHVKDAWRRIKLANMKKGHWSQDEYQTLFDLVNMDLQLKVSEEKKSKHGMLRDNISWSAISDKLSTRTTATCCRKWYNQLTSSMVSEGNWAHVDDYRLLAALYDLDACCIEDVEWDDLLDHRPGDVCRKRWGQMVLHIGQHASKSFAEQVEILAKRYCPELIDARETWDNKPLVP
ncbi:hypothetical protein RJ639_001552 [Escallonia herrerae]|uniref:Myb-like domain-containing protein n=1 Tax=Escallonia herrerae TaxID=1293975 RepID=A0AA88X9Z6_9ASTE|nr:hypothetical protein RJ639_001552 [Escallonia herrerae]